MRPVNLIPPEERRGTSAQSRTGALPYVLVGLLVIALGAVTLIVTTNNKISDRRAQVATLEGQVAAAKAEADRLADYANFASLQESRYQTVSTLARSRFNWERVMRELAIVIPSDVWLTEATAKVSPAADIASGSSSNSSSSGGGDLSGGITGPSIELQGCAANHDAVARFAASLEDIDGVTRVGVAKSERSVSVSPGSGSATGGDCRTRPSISQFDITIAFDSVQVDPSSSLPVPPPAPTSDAGVAGAQAQEQTARDSVQNGINKAHEDVNTFVPGTVR
jgi:Tfp pilus assembly protein PilN